jgi:FKBP-type peptidyl-prolyl cis-trans isomerase 2
MFNRLRFVTTFPGLFVLFSLLPAGCAMMQTPPPAVTAGQPVQVEYTCTLTDGSLAATTSAEAVQSAVQSNDTPHSAIFAPPQKYGPVLMTAGEVAECTECDRDKRYFGLVLEETIQKQLVGLVPGRKTPLAAATDEMLMDEKEGTIKIRRNQSRLKVKPFDGKQMEKMLGRSPEAGESLAGNDSGMLPFKVLENTGSAVIVEFQVDQGKPFPTPFGPAAIESVSDKEFRIRINPAIGHLIRSGGLIGRVVAFDDDYLTLDYRHPFGYEELQCEVTVEEQQAPAAEAQSRLTTAGQ